MSYEGFDISGKAILVTGGTSGIGLAIAKGLISAGAHVVVGSSSLAKVESARAELGDGNDAVQLDVTDETSVAAVISHIAQKYQKLDAVVHAAGVISRGPSIDLPVAEFRRVVETNLTGNFIVAQAAARVMRNQPFDSRGQRGCIVNIASLNSYVSLSEVLAYAASKSGVMALTRGLANEWGQYGIRVNGIAPGVFPTDLNRKLIENTARGDWLKNHTPLGRFGQTEELVGAAIYLISPAASFTSGQTLIIDGGFLAKGA